MQIARKHSIESKILTLHGVQVMLDQDLAEIYQVETKAMNRAVKRNLERFPEVFMFQLTQQEVDSLRSQIVTLEPDNLRCQIGTSSLRSHLIHGGRRYLPYAFTEQGVAMLSAILRSNTAVKVSIEIMNAFVQMRRLMLANIPLYQRLDHLELKQIAADQKFEQIFTALEKDVKPQHNIIANILKFRYSLKIKATIVF